MAYHDEENRIFYYGIIEYLEKFKGWDKDRVANWLREYESEEMAEAYLRGDYKDKYHEGMPEGLPFVANPDFSAGGHIKARNSWV